MSTAEDLLTAALKELPPKPTDSAKQSEKKAYSEKFSERTALAFSDALRGYGLEEVRPASPGELGVSGAERRMSGGIGAKKVDVTWATPESGLLLAISIKTVNFVDRRSGNFQKNLTNRRGDMLFEAVTLHRRFPYATLGGFFFFDQGADADNSDKRSSTFMNAHSRLRLFTGRAGPSDPDEQYEHFFIALHDANQFKPVVRFYRAGEPKKEVSLSDALWSLLETVVERNTDFYELKGAKLRKA